MSDKTPAQLVVEALRSGEYTQAKQRLRDGEGYCCLGVTCDVFQKVTGRGKWIKSQDPYYPYSFEVDGDNNGLGLPDPVREWIGFDENEGSYKDSGYGLSSHNDEGDTFEEIADIIEAAPPGLFQTEEDPS
jgi:hypothetical protein